MMGTEEGEDKADEEEDKADEEEDKADGDDEDGSEDAGSDGSPGGEKAVAVLVVEEAVVVLAVGEEVAGEVAAEEVVAEEEVAAGRRWLLQTRKLAARKRIGEDLYIITDAKKTGGPRDTKVPGSKGAEEVNKMFRDMENKVMEKAMDPMKESGSGKEAPIKQTQKWWDIRNWPHEVLERMTNSPWQGESQSDDGGRASPTNLLREPDFLKRLDEYTSMDQKDDHLEYYKRDRPYSLQIKTWSTCGIQRSGLASVTRKRAPIW